MISCSQGGVSPLISAPACDNFTSYLIKHFATVNCSTHHTPTVKQACAADMAEGTPSQAGRVRQTPQSSRAPPSSGRQMVASIETSDITQRSTSFSQASLSPTAPLFRPPESPHTSIDSRAAKATKVAIPRLKRSEGSVGDVGSRTGGRHRVTHACEPCRHRKTKCSGERPVCRHCQDFKITCYYADGKRDRAKK